MNFMKIIFSLAVFLCYVSITVQASGPITHTDWHSGIIILNDQSIISGDISYDYKYDLIMYRNEGKTQTFTSRQISSFSYYDAQKNILHKFITLVYTSRPYFEQRAFFEVILNGDISYLRKHNRFPTYDATEKQLLHLTTNRGKNPHVVCYDYFVYINQNLIKASQFNKKVLPLMLKKDQSLNNYIKKENLRTYDTGDQITLIRYFNAQEEDLKTTVLQDY